LESSSTRDAVGLPPQSVGRQGGHLIWRQPNGHQNCR
jgi:hypothetical protein